jgi:RNA polymerase sigma factor (sigma-70 family)
MPDDGRPILDFPTRIPGQGQETAEEIDRVWRGVFGENVTLESLQLRAIKHAMKLTRYDVDEAADIVQEAFVKLLRTEFPAKIDNGFAFMSRIVSNEYISRYRRRQREAELVGVKTEFDGGEVESSLKGSDFAEKVVISLEIRARVESLIDSYPDDDQRLSLTSRLDLDNGELRPLEEVAALTGFSLSKVKHHCRDVLPRLRENLADLLMLAEDTDASANRATTAKDNA